MFEVLIKVQLAGMFVWNRLKEGWADESGGIAESTVMRALFIALAIAVVGIIAGLLVAYAHNIANLFNGAGGAVPGGAGATTQSTAGVVPGN